MNMRLTFYAREEIGHCVTRKLSLKYAYAGSKVCFLLILLL